METKGEGIYGFRLMQVATSGAARQTSSITLAAERGGRESS